MKDYHKIQGIFKRYGSYQDERDQLGQKGRFNFNDFTTPEFGYLKDNQWIGTEKIDGSNIKILWGSTSFQYEGRTKKANLPVRITEVIDSYISRWCEGTVLLDTFDSDKTVTLYGEAYGDKIQKIGKLYKPDGVDFILFDVKVEKGGSQWWLNRQDVDSLAKDLGIQSVPTIFQGTITEGIDFVKHGFLSSIGKNVPAEGIVITPVVPVKDRFGNRIITKLKTCDFR